MLVRRERRLVGVSEATAATLRTGVREQLPTPGAVPPPIEIEHVPAIERDASGKAPLVVSRLPRRPVA